MNETSAKRSNDLPAPLFPIAPSAGRRQKPGVAARVHNGVFTALYQRSLIYNTCWEDPAVDRMALGLQPDDVVLVITSAGCNALDYALLGPRRIHAVDANPRQTALLELKLAGIRALEFGDFWRAFGEGHHADFAALYRQRLRGLLSPFAQRYWDRHARWFHQADPRDTFYFFGLAGRVARVFRAYLAMKPRLRRAIEDMVEAPALDEQRRIYDQHIAPLLWSRAVRWALSRQITMSMIGVPHAQTAEVERQNGGGVPGFVREALEYLCRELPLRNNYFWTLYFRGRYTPDNCPEYLKPGNFAALKDGLAERVVPHTATVADFLEEGGEPISKFVLLDHMDWMSEVQPEALAREWQAILRRAAAGARVLFRSAHAHPRFLASLRVPVHGRQRGLYDLLQFHPELARELTRLDRVHTYAGFHVADIRGLD